MGAWPPPLGFSTWRLPTRGIWGEPRDRQSLLGVLRRAVELGVGLVEVVPVPGPLSVEDLVREALAPYPEGLVIAVTTDGETQRQASARRLGLAPTEVTLVAPHADPGRITWPDGSVTVVVSAGSVAALDEAVAAAGSAATPRGGGPG